MHGEGRGARIGVAHREQMGLGSPLQQAVALAHAEAVLFIDPPPGQSRGEPAPGLRARRGFATSASTRPLARSCSSSGGAARCGAGVRQGGADCRIWGSHSPALAGVDAGAQHSVGAIRAPWPTPPDAVSRAGDRHTSSCRLPTSPLQQRAMACSETESGGISASTRCWAMSRSGKGRTGQDKAPPGFLAPGCRPGAGWGRLIVGAGAFQQVQPFFAATAAHRHQAVRLARSLLPVCAAHGFPARPSGDSINSQPLAQKAAGRGIAPGAGGGSTACHRLAIGDAVRASVSHTQAAGRRDLAGATGALGGFEHFASRVLGLGP